MKSGRPVLLVALALAATCLSLVPTAAEALTWNRRRLFGCEPPARFYSDLHRPGVRPCCPLVVGLCPGGAACPASGVCPTEGVRCQPGQPVERPNLIVMLSDDQGDCHYGTAGECRSVQSGTPIPAPVTPSLDLLSGYSTTFPIAHNTAAWCFPSINSLLTGRYQKSFGTPRQVADAHPTIPQALRAIGADDGAPVDPYDDGNRIGGYCTFLGGKFTGATGDPGFDAEARGRRLGRTQCIEGEDGAPPRCGSAMQDDYDPRFVQGMDDFFQFLEGLPHRAPDQTPATYRVQPFFAWYAPRVPHAPLRAPSAITRYLFGQRRALGSLDGLFQLGDFCTGSSCPPVVRAFSESSFGTGYEFYGSMWWIDDNLREIRKYLAKASEPHCIGPSGAGSYRATTPGACLGTWAAQVTPALDRNTVIVYLTDNGWFLPNSKHHYTENGYRTRMLVFDPRNLETLPPWDPTGVTPLPDYESDGLAHAVDVLPTMVGFAKGTQGPEPCPTSQSDGTPCDGRDLRPHLVTADGGPAPVEELRHSLCGHQTQRAQAPTRNRYLVTRPGAVGRCVDQNAPACESDLECDPNSGCIGGRCMPKVEGRTCSASTPCPAGALCLGGKCRVAPACVSDVGCGGMFPTGDYACAELGTHWCRNAPNVECTRRDDCPSCPLVNGREVPCARLCEPRILKFYVKGITAGGKPPETQMVDLFLDPDEVSLHGGTNGSMGTILGDMSHQSPAYRQTAETLNCCVDEWWPAGADSGTTCKASCPANLKCD